MLVNVISNALIPCAALALVLPVLNVLIFWRRGSWPVFAGLTAVSALLFGVSLLAYSFEIWRLVDVEDMSTIIDTAAGYCLLFTFAFLAVVLLNLIACAVCVGRSRSDG